MSVNEAKSGYAEQGVVIATACDLKGWTLTKLCQVADIPSSRMDRILHGARIRHDDGLKLEDVLGLERGRLSMAYRAWAKDRKRAESTR